MADSTGNSNPKIEFSSKRKIQYVEHPQKSPNAKEVGYLLFWHNKCFAKSLESQKDC